MALQPLPPIPNTRLVDDPARDAIWRRYLEQLFNRIIPLVNVHNDLTGLQGGTTNEYYHLTQAQHSTVTSFGTFTNNRVLVTGPTSSITTNVALQYLITSSTLTATNISTVTILSSSTATLPLVNIDGGNIDSTAIGANTASTGVFTNVSTATLFASGNVALGDASGDTLTINAGTWTLGSDFVETRAAGTVATGTFDIAARTITYTGDAGGNSSPRGYRFMLQNTGANPVNNPISMRVFARNSGTGLVTQGWAIEGAVWNSGTGGFTQADSFRASTPTVSAGSIGTARGLRINNQGNASITTALGVLVDDFSGSTTMRAYSGELSAGTGKQNLYMSGTAENILVGNLRVGSTTSPTVALDVVGAISATSTATLPLVNIDGGNIDSTAIGATTASTGVFTNISTTAFFTSTSVFDNVSTRTIFATSTATFPLVNIDGGFIDSTAIGATTASTGVYTNVSTTTLFSTSTATLPLVNIDGGNIDSTAIGAATSSTGVFTNVSTTTLFVSGDATIGDAAADTLTINAETVSQPNIPLFLAYLSANTGGVTGAGTNYDIVCDTEVKDQSGDYNAATGVFTAPATGTYRFDVAARLAAVSTAMTQRLLLLVTSNRSYGTLDLWAPNVTANTSHVISTPVDMDAGDTAFMRVNYANGAGDTAVVVGASTLYTRFGGERIA